MKRPGSGVPPKRVVAIDGPSGSGKSTVARAVAQRLGLDVLDTGAMYRAATLAALRDDVALDDAGALRDLTERVSLVVSDRVMLDGRDVTAEIRGPEVTAAVSAVSAHEGVRAVLVARQRAWAETREGGVVEGRDIGTVVFPDAAVKVFLTASDEERARRRTRDEADAARTADLRDVAASMARRDHLDSNRAASPLVAAADAVVVDTTGRGIDDIVAEIVRRAESVLPPARGEH